MHQFLKLATRVLRHGWKAALACCAGALLATATLPAVAASYVGQGKIAAIYTYDSTVSDAEGIAVTGFTSAGTCPTNDGMVFMLVRNDFSGRNHLAAALAAKASGATVTVYVDDTLKQGSYCVLRMMQW